MSQSLEQNTREECQAIPPILANDNLTDGLLPYQPSVNLATDDYDDKVKMWTESLNSEGHVSVDGNKMSFVSNNFIEQLQSSGSSRNASPTSSVSSSTNKVKKLDIPQINPNIISKLEQDCSKMTNSVDDVIAELTQRLHKISAISVANSQTCEGKVEEMMTHVDSAVHTMYSLVAHCEELDKSMKPIYEVAEKISSINEILSALETNLP